jgi:predicted ABC-type transport system involved in lysophospholipase L1 biosynthesis ATPase subunit
VTASWVMRNADRSMLDGLGLADRASGYPDQLAGREPAAIARQPLD